MTYTHTYIHTYIGGHTYIDTQQTTRHRHTHTTHTHDIDTLYTHPSFSVCTLVVVTKQHTHTHTQHSSLSPHWQYTRSNPIYPLSLCVLISPATTYPFHYLPLPLTPLSYHYPHRYSYLQGWTLLRNCYWAPPSPVSTTNPPLLPLPPSLLLPPGVDPFEELLLGPTFACLNH